MTAANWETLKDKGNDAFKSNLFDAAIQFYSEAIEANPSECVLYSNRSAAYLKKGEFQLAATDARKAIDLDKGFARAYTRLHTALCNSGQFQEAAQAIQAGLPSVAAPADVKNLRELQRSAEGTACAVDEARQLIAAGELDTATRLLREPLRLFPDCPEVAFLFAEATVASEPDVANKLLTPFTYTHNADPHYLYLRALALYYRGPDGSQSAQNILRQTLEMDPDNAKVSGLLRKIRAIERHKETGNAAFKAKRAQDAVAAYTDAIDVDPFNSRVNATIRGNRAAARMDLKEFQAALMDCDFAIANGCTTAKMYARRSRIQESLENFEDAVRDMQQAVEADRSFEAELRAVKVRAKRASRKDYYKTLTLSQRDCDTNSLKRAYKKACLQWHPDKWAHASEEEKVHAEKQFKEIGEAYNVLSDPQKKRLYDSGQLDNNVEGSGGMSGTGSMGGMHHGGDEDFVNIMNMMFGGGGGGGFQQQQGFPGGFQQQQQGFRGGMPRQRRGF